MLVINSKEDFKKMFFEMLDEYHNLNKNTSDDKLFDSESAAKFLNIAIGTFYNLKSLGKIKPSKHIGSKPMYYKSYLQQIKV